MAIINIAQMIDQTFDHEIIKIMKIVMVNAKIILGMKINRIVMNLF